MIHYQIRLFQAHDASLKDTVDDYCKGPLWKIYVLKAPDDSCGKSLDAERSAST